MDSRQDNLKAELESLLKTNRIRPKKIGKNMKEVTLPSEAEVFQFHVSDGDENHTVTIGIDEQNTLTLMFDDAAAKTDQWRSLFPKIKYFTVSNQMKFDTENQDRLDTYMAKRKQQMTKKNRSLREGYYALGKQRSVGDHVPTVKIVIEHDRKLAETDQRFRSVARIFLENSVGERVLCPTKRPSLARVFARVLAEGDLPYGQRWQHLEQLVEEFRKVSGFVAATRNHQLSENSDSVISVGRAHHQSLKETLKKITGHRGYHQYFENFTPMIVETNDVALEKITEIYSERDVDPRIIEAMPILYRVKSQSKPEAIIREVQSLQEWTADVMIDTAVCEGMDRRQALKMLGLAGAGALGVSAADKIGTELKHMMAGKDEHRTAYLRNLRIAGASDREISELGKLFSRVDAAEQMKAPDLPKLQQITASKIREMERQYGVKFYDKPVTDLEEDNHQTVGTDTSNLVSGMRKMQRRAGEEMQPEAMSETDSRAQRWAQELAAREPVEYRVGERVFATKADAVDFAKNSGGSVQAFDSSGQRVPLPRDLTESDTGDQDIDSMNRAELLKHLNMKDADAADMSDDDLRALCRDKTQDMIEHEHAQELDEIAPALAALGSTVTRVAAPMAKAAIKTIGTELGKKAVDAISKKLEGNSEQLDENFSEQYKSTHSYRKKIREGLQKILKEAETRMMNPDLVQGMTDAIHDLGHNVPKEPEAAAAYKQGYNQGKKYLAKIQAETYVDTFDIKIDGEKLKVTARVMDSDNSVYEIIKIEDAKDQDITDKLSIGDEWTEQVWRETEVAAAEAGAPAYTDDDYAYDQFMNQKDRESDLLRESSEVSEIIKLSRMLSESR